MKKLILKCHFIFVTSLASLISISALANDGGIEVISDGTKAGTVVPIKVTDIRLVEEHVTITKNNTRRDNYRYTDDKAEVHTKLIFWNGSKKAQKILIGFPVDDTYSIKVDEFSAIPDSSLQQINEKNKKWEYLLKTKVNGKPFSVSEVKPGKSLTSKNAQKTWNYFVFNVTFPPNQKTIIEHNYEILPNINYASTPEENTDELKYGYISSTGQFWKGKPDKTVFEFRNKGTSHSVVDYSGPGEAKKEVFFRDGYTVYRATHLKPTLSNDVEFKLSNRGTNKIRCENRYNDSELGAVLDHLLEKEGSWSFNLELTLTKDNIKNFSWADRLLVGDLAHPKGISHVCRKGFQRYRPELIHKCVLIDGPANMRLFPGGPVIASVKDGAFVHVYEQRGDWYGLVAAKESHCLIPEPPYEMWRERYDTPLYLGFTHKGNIKYNLKPTAITKIILRNHLDEAFGYASILKREDKYFIPDKMLNDAFKNLRLERTDTKLEHPEHYNSFYYHVDLKSGQWGTEKEVQEKFKPFLREAYNDLREKLNAKLAKVINKSDCSTKDLQSGVFRLPLTEMVFERRTSINQCWRKVLLPVYEEAVSQVKQIKTITQWTSVAIFHIETNISRDPDDKLKFDPELKANFHFSIGHDGKIHGQRYFR